MSEPESANVPSSSLGSLALPLSAMLLLAGAGPGGTPGGGLGQQDRPERKVEKTGGARSCSTAACHEAYAKLRIRHGPVVLGRCDVCHEPDEDSTPYESGDDHTFELVARDGRLCEQCHESQATEAHVHYPLKRSQCIACHEPHGSDNPAMLRRANIADNCFECHEQEVRDEPFLHAPVAIGACTACHDPHSSPHPWQLVAVGSELCLGCHTEKRKELATRRHVHRPVIEDCGQCHDPHDGPDPARLRKRVPELCFGCHANIAEKTAKSEVKHGALDQDRSCLHCHDPHAAGFSRLLRQTPADLCLSCHDTPMLTETGMLPNMKSHLAANPEHHTPVRQGECSACHEPHGSANRRLLRRSYPEEFYAPFAVERYQLCFSCHEKEKILVAETETLTAFRNGKKNLHFVHVNDPLKGRTCRACHDVHASKSPKQIRSTVPYGSSWYYPLRFDLTASGGRCGPACHKERRYDRLEAVEKQ
ncbi:MAG: cytochrome c3 family protein [Planctomycetota bacterium]